MSGKQLNGPTVAVIITVLVVLVVGVGYYLLNKDSMGKEGEARMLNRPGVLSKDYDPKLGPFPDSSSNGAIHTPSGSFPASGQSPMGMPPGGPGAGMSGVSAPGGPGAGMSGVGAPPGAPGAPPPGSMSGAPGAPPAK